MQKIFFQDNQVHSTYSDGSISLEEILEYNQTHDKLDLTFTDHVNKQTDWFSTYVKHLQKLRKQYTDFSIRIGCEVKILDDGTLNTTNAILKQCEVVLGSVHYFEGIKTMSPEALMKREYELALLLAQNKQITILSHPFSMGYRFHKIGPPIAWVKKVYEQCVKTGILFEYNEKNCPDSVRTFVMKLVKEGKTSHLSFGSDMHDDLTEIGRSGYSVQDTIPVMVTGTGTGVGQGILKALELSPLRLKVIGVDASEMAAGLYRTDTAYIVPYANNTAYIPRIIEICKKEKVKVIFPGNELELEVLAKNARVIKQKTGAEVIVHSIEAIQIADDKWKTVEFLKKNAFPYPESCTTDTVESFVRKHSYPLIVKPRVGARSIGVSIVHTEKELAYALETTPDAVVQEYLSNENEEFTCTGFFINRKNYGVISARRWLRNGDTYKAHFFHDKKLEAFVISVGKKLSLHGPCNFQLRQTKKGPVIFEINARFSGTTGPISYLGFNCANALLQILVLKRAPYQLSFNESYALRYWNEIFTSEDQVKTLQKTKKLDSPRSSVNKL